MTNIVMYYIKGSRYREAYVYSLWVKCKFKYLNYNKCILHNDKLNSSTFSFTFKSDSFLILRESVFAPSAKFHTPALEVICWTLAPDMPAALRAHCP